jgi:glycosyltransferase involved in cell wall biosynthesis
VISNPSPTGLGAAVRQGLAEARDRGYDAAVYLDGDGEYDPADFERVLEPIARGRAEYVVGSRFLGDRDGMSWHRTLANRLTSALLGTLMETVISDGQSGYRAFGRRALAEARIRHDYNYAQVLTLSLWGSGIDPVEVPISYRRRENGQSFVRYPEYFARVAPALWREFRHARRQRATNPAPSAPAITYGAVLSSKNGNTSSSGPQGASGLPAASPPSPQRTST